MQIRACIDIIAYSKKHSTQSVHTLRSSGYLRIRCTGFKSSGARPNGLFRSFDSFARNSAIFGSDSHAVSVSMAAPVLPQYST